VALYFHTSTMLLSALPLLIGWPSHAVWLSWSDALLLVGVAATSFAGQLFLTRGFQLLPAGKAAGFNFSQVGSGRITLFLYINTTVTLFKLQKTFVELWQSRRLQLLTGGVWLKIYFSLCN
jgi:hypothetical protein